MGTPLKGHELAMCERVLAYQISGGADSYPDGFNLGLDQMNVASLAVRLVKDLTAVRRMIEWQRGGLEGRTATLIFHEDGIACELEAGVGLENDGGISIKTSGEGEEAIEAVTVAVELFSKQEERWNELCSIGS